MRWKKSMIQQSQNTKMYACFIWCNITTVQMMYSHLNLPKDQGMVLTQLHPLVIPKQQTRLQPWQQCVADDSHLYCSSHSYNESTKLIGEEVTVCKMALARSVCCILHVHNVAQCTLHCVCCKHLSTEKKKRKIEQHSETQNKLMQPFKIK